MKISIQHYSEIFSIEMPEESTTDQLMRAFVSLAIASGFPEKNIIEMFEDGDPREWEDAWRIR